MAQLEDSCQIYFVVPFEHYMVDGQAGIPQPPPYSVIDISCKYFR